MLAAPRSAPTTSSAEGSSCPFPLWGSGVPAGMGGPCTSPSPQGAVSEPGADRGLCFLPSLSQRAGSWSPLLGRLEHPGSAGLSSTFSPCGLSVEGVYLPMGLGCCCPQTQACSHMVAPGSIQLPIAAGVLPPGLCWRVPHELS